MKTKNFKSKQLLKLHLLRSRVYEYPIKKTNFTDLKNINLDQILVEVRKALQIIFQYNQVNKRILFIGLPSKLEFRINTLTRHVAIPNTYDIQGIISNNKSNNLLSDLKCSTLNSIKKSSIIPSSKLTKTPDLIILFDHDKSRTVLSEAWVAKIPVITFVNNNDCKDLVTQNSYPVNGNFKSILTTFDKNIFFISLNFLFKNRKKKKTTSVLPTSNSQSFVKNRKKF